MKDNIIAGLDIGSTSIRLVAGQKTVNESGEQLQILGAVTVPAEGINRGVVNSIEDATSAISACLEKAERLGSSKAIIMCFLPKASLTIVAASTK